MSHVVDCVYRPVYLALYAGVATGSAALVLEDGAGFVLVALEAFVQLSVYYVRMVHDQGEHEIRPHTFLVLRVFQSQVSVHASEKPKDFMEALRCLWEAKWCTPQERTGRVRSVVK